jgi:cytochrome c oxidase assembly protein subunit 11
MLVTVVFLMLGLAYASVPLYDLFCRVTGFGGTPAVSLEKSEYSISQNINIRLDANVTNLNWDFFPEKNVYKIKIGENKVINYLAQNLSNEKQVGTALFNVTPEQAGQYFTKIECFCFHDLMLEPGEEIKLPVSFYIDPEIIDDQFLKDLSEVTLSYTFYKNADTPIS